MDWVKQHGAEQPTESGTTALRIYLLGTPRVEWADCPLTIPRRQARALLYRLAVQPHSLSREHLCFLFWPDTPESTARRNLSRLLTHLRRALPAPEMLVTSGDRIALDPHLTWSDTATFGRLVTLQDTRRQAVDLYRGPFLSDFSLPGSPEFEAWVTQEREYWERSYLETLATLVESRATKGEHAAAIDYARRYLETDDLAEDIHRRLIELYALTGDRGAALRQFERCVTVLERELGVSPLPETQAAYRAILEGRSLPRVAPVTAPAWATLPSLDVPLVGREGVLDRLERAHVKVRTGHGRVILISGEAGIGKSRLMQDFATGLQSQTLVLAGAGYPNAQTMPYQPVVEALRPALGVKRPRFEAQVLWLAEASRLMPELRDVYPNLPPPMPLEPDHARARLFEALCQLILGLSDGSRPVLLCLDDLHWADSATLDWLAYLGRRLQKGPLLVVGAYRSEESRAVAELRRGLTRQGVLFELKLVGLDKTGVLELLRHLKSPVPDDKALAGRLQQATGGNPFFLLETLRALIESGQRLDEPVSLEGLPLPDTVRDAVKRRTERLSPKARQVLETGAVLGQAFVFDTVYLTAGRREMETMDGLEELVARQLLTEQTAEYRFCHEIVREAVYRELGHWRRRLLHRRAGEALEKLQPDGAATLAWHFERAEEPGRAIEKAITYSKRAGEQAAAQFAHAEAVAHLSRALDLTPETDYASRFDLLMARERIHAIQGEAEARLQDLVSLKELAQELTVGMRAEVALRRARYAQDAGDYPAAIAAAQTAIELAQTSQGASVASRGYLSWGQALIRQGEYSLAQSQLEQALALAQTGGSRKLEGSSQNNLGLVSYHQGDYAQARAHYEQALHVFREMNDLWGQSAALNNLGVVSNERGDNAAAGDFYRQALHIHQRTGNRRGEGLVLGNLGNIAAEEGEYVKARFYHEQSLSIARELGHQLFEGNALLNLGNVALYLGEYGDAGDRYESALRTYRQMGHRSGESWGLTCLNLLSHRLNDDEEAVAYGRQALLIAQETGDRLIQGYAWTHMGHALAGLGHLDEAADAYREAISIRRELVSLNLVAESLSGLARVCLDQNDLTQAQTHVEEIVGLLETHTLNGTEEPFRIYLTCYRVLRTVQPSRALDVLEAAYNLLQAQATKIQDGELRRSFLENVAPNREIVAAFREATREDRLRTG